MALPFLLLGPAVAAAAGSSRGRAEAAAYSDRRATAYDDGLDDDDDEFADGDDDVTTFEVRGPDMDSVAKRSRSLSQKPGKGPSSSRKAARKRAAGERKGAAAATPAAKAKDPSNPDEEVPLTFAERMDLLGERIAEIGQKITQTTKPPPIGSARLSYARFLHMLDAKMVKRVTFMDDGKVALVELPIPMGGHDYKAQRYAKHDPSLLFVPELPEWRIEVLRYYVELPGDFFWKKRFHHTVWKGLPHRTGDGFTSYQWQPRDCQFYLEAVNEPAALWKQWIAQYRTQTALVLFLVFLQWALLKLETFLDRIGRLRGRKLSAKQQLMVDMSRSIAKSYNVGGDEVGTGVDFEDVQGIDEVKNEIKEVLTMLTGDEAYEEIGATTPKGILLAGPPGTGKTFLAKAMATEAKVPFFSANGGEFVQMFSGVASARVRELFEDAKKAAPAIIFIDEIDAIGRSRDDLNIMDVAGREREQGLMQMLVQMDGFRKAERVLVLGATNRPEVLDDALVRPGRFDRVINMGNPTADNRYRILCVHARGKQIPRGDDDALLREAAARSGGFSGADLANMLNEAAILQVRYAKTEVDLDILQEVIDKARTGLPGPPVPLSNAKRQLAMIWASKAVTGVACGDVYGRLDSVSLQTIGSDVGRMLWGQDLMWSFKRGEVGDFQYAVDLLVPCYAARAAEEVHYGSQSTTLQSGTEIANAGELARWLCINSQLNPALFGLKVAYDDRDAVTQFMPVKTLEDLVLRIQTLAYHKALRITHERRAAIETIAAELLASPRQVVPGKRVYELLAQPPAEVPEEVLQTFPYSQLLPDAAKAHMHVEEKALVRAIGLVKGDIDPGMFFDAATLRTISDKFGRQSAEWRRYRESLDNYATDEAAPYPERPDLAEPALVV